MLLKYLRDGVEATIGTWMLPMRARQEAKVKRIESESQAERFKIVASGQKDALNVLLENTLESSISVELRNQNNMPVISSQGEKRQKNILDVVIEAAKILEGKETEVHDPDPDLTANFFKEVQDVSSKQLKSFWSKILANEIQNPGQTSLRTLSVLKNMSQKDALRFEKLAHYVINGAFVYYDSYTRENIFRGGDLHYADIQFLAECNLAIIENSSQFQVHWANKDVTIFPYHFKYLLIQKLHGASGTLSIPAQTLTTAGKELYRIIDTNVHEGYLMELSMFLARKKCQLFMLEDPHKLPDGTIRFTKKTPVEP